MIALAFSADDVQTYNGSFIEHGREPVFYEFKRNFQELTEASYDVEIQLESRRGSNLVHGIFCFDLIVRGGGGSNIVVRKKNPCLLPPET